MMPASSADRFRRGFTAGAVGAAAILGARAFLKPKAAATRRLLDWAAVRRAALDRSGSGGRMMPATRARRSEGFQEMAQELAPLLGEVCPDVLFPVPAITAVDRAGFIDANIRIASRLLQPVERLRATLPESAATALGRRVMNRYVGELFGLMSRRVLGQYDPVLTFDPSGDEHPSLFMVEPNLTDVQRSQELDGDSLRRWILLHELTHAWQFSQHPWLREHIEEQVRRMVVESVSRNGTLLDSRDFLQRLPETLRTQLRTVSALQALMSVLEGYSNFVMHRVGRRHVRDADELDAALQRRRRERTAIERLVLSITGLEMKLRQYEVGERFCDAVAERAGIDALNRVWESAAMMPTSAELKRPGDWLARTS
jgi:coenzyme F420 biosynthesis associated uncharacterized protein